ncbi:hypothetical protein ACJ6WD_39965 [Streptomyces sp. VTCC 41912]|uniref:hypothetical protein n=1 Tax=Streptomyces sp. VTCC 41912 TaxID=3383243 RepID=UPI00389697C7
MILADDPCSWMPAGAQAECQGKQAPSDPFASLDPLTQFAKSAAHGAAWISRQLANSLDHGPLVVDFTKSGWLQQYAVVFAGSAVLTLVVWLIAVAKRAVRGARLTTAIGEAIGLLWLTVAASAFTPLALYITVQAVDAVTRVFGGTSAGELFGSLADSLEKGGEGIGGGPLVLLGVSILIIALSGALWLLLVLRSTSLYVGGVFAPVVYSGLVDRKLWGKVRLWSGLMAALIMMEPILVATLGIANVFTAERGKGSFSVVAAGITVIIVSIGAGVSIFRFVPGYGDDIVSGVALRTAKGGAKAGIASVKIADNAAGMVARGIQTHGTRTPKQGGGGKKNGNSVADGIQAHGSRKDKGNSGK